MGYLYDDNYYQKSATLLVQAASRVASRLSPKVPVKTFDNLYSCPTCGVGVFMNIDQCNWCKQNLIWRH